MFSANKFCKQKDRNKERSGGLPEEKETFYQTVVANVVCWWDGNQAWASHQAKKLVRRVHSMVGPEVNCLETVAERRMKDKIKAILDNPSHPFQHELWQMGS